MSGGYNDDGYHFNEYEAKEVVEQMYHVKDNKKYIGEKYDMNKAHEICERYKEVLPNDVEPCDVYVAINAQYHDYAKLFEEWFGDNIDNKVFESAITFWFKDVDFGMDKFIDVIVDGILNNFDFGFMFIVNVLTYIIIKVIDYFNGDNKVPTWQKRCVLVISIAAMIGIYITAGYDNTIMLVNSAVLAPVFWSWVVSPILKKLGVGYKDIDNTIG